MGSQTFEILRQGVWASLTGGWFYDPHQDIFCNTFHLYIWLFLLCLPFTVYLFFPPTLLVWGCYCIVISILFGILKLVNLGLHHMYDTSECIREEPEELDGGDDVCRLTQHFRSRREEDGIELQVLGGSKRTSDTPPVGCASRSSFSEQQQQPSQQIADTDSIGFNSSSDIHEARHSLEDMVGFNAGGASTIDLKVDVHRKNSSESSEEVALRPVVERVSIHRAEPCTQADHERLCSKMHEKRSRQRAGSMSVVVVDDQCSGGEIRRGKSLRRKASASAATVDCHEERRHRRHHRPSLVSIESGTVAVSTPLQACVRRLSNTSNGSLGFLPGSSAGPPPPTIKPTGSLELGHMLEREKGLVYWKQQNTRQVRCIRSGVMELYSTVPEGGLSGTSSPSPASHHYPSYGSEIVYPIAEQSDEHQTSHGADTDPEDRADDDNGGSRSPLLIRHESFEGQKGASTVPDAVGETQPGSRHASVRSCGINSAGAGVSFSTTSLDQACEAVFRKHFGAGSSRDELLDESVRARSDGSEQSGDEDSGASSGSRPIQELMNFGFMIGEAVACVPPCGQQECVTCGMVSSPSVVMSPKEAPSLVGLDWLFEHTDSETAQTPPPVERDANLWNCTRSDDSDCGSMPDVRNTCRKHSEDSGSSSTTLSLDHEVVKLLPGNANANEAGSRNQGAIPKQRPKRCNSRKGSSEEIRGLTTVNSLVKIDEKPRQRRPHREKERTSDEIEVKSTRASKLSNQPTGSCRKDVENRGESSRHSRHPILSNRREVEDPEILPPAPVVAAFLAARRDLGENLSGWGMTGPVVTPVRGRHQRLKRSSRIHRSRLGVARESQQGSLVPSSSSPPSAVRQNVGNQSSTYTQTLASAISGGTGTHIATSHNDTTEGAVHYFQDEHGNWMSYTFHERGSGTANAGVMPIALSGGGESPGNSSSGSARTACGNTKGSVPVPLLPLLQYPLHHHDVYVLEAVMPSSQRSPFHVLTTDGSHRQTCRLACRTSESGPPLPLSSGTDTEGTLSHAGGGRFCFADTLEAVNDSTIRKYDSTIRKYYDLHLFKCFSLKVRFDRLALIALLDRNLTSLEAFLSCVLAIAVAVLGATLLQLGFYRDILAFFFCFVIAGCQYSLLKSVQPDAASPTHGFNRVVALSRPVYFILISGLVLSTHSALTSGSASTMIRRIYGIEFSTYTLSQTCRDTLVTLLLLLPVAFSLGLLPQVTTFAMYVLEQLDMHVFGGNAAAGLGAATLSVCRSLIAVALLTGFAYGALSEKQQSQHVLFSIFCGLLVATAYMLSRQASDPGAVWAIVKSALWPADLMPPSGAAKPPAQPKEQKDKKKPKDAESAAKSDISQAESDTTDPLPFKVQQTVQARLRSDGLVCLVTGLLICGIHASTAFTALQSEQSELSTALLAAACALGLVLHYIMPQLRKQLPWLCISRPVLRAHEHSQFEVRQPARLMWFEKVFVILGFLERNILYPVLIVGAVTNGAPILAKNLGPGWGALVVTVCGLKCLRCSFSDCSFQYLVLAFAELLFQFDFVKASHTFIVDYFFMGILFSKMYEFLLKVQFVVTYIAPWQITWGSAFHAFAQPFSVPHSAMLFTQAAISALFSAPLNPFLGSAVFLASYARPVKFWERDYKTRRADHSNTRLAAHLLEHRSLGADDNNLNSIFYEHLTRSLQHSLCGDLVLGRWGPVSQGDCFVLASDYLNCLVHIVELGNGLVTFQVRGLEFRGTYCQQREVEAISEGVEDNDGCCCCEPGHLPHMLSINAAFSQRWLAWEVTATKYVLEGYSISDNSAVSMLQVFDFRKVLITYYVKSIIFYAVRSPRLTEWLTSSTILDALRPTLDPLFVDLDPVFNMNIDEDFDLRAAGITRSSFCKVYLNWIHFCASKRKEMEDAGKIDSEQTAKDILLNHLTDKAQESTLVSLCFALSLLGRRTLGAASHNTVSSVEFFLYGLHALFKGDFRITSARDEWIFSDMELLRKVVAPGVRMSLKLHQDHFMSPDEYVDPAALYEAISSHEEKLVISHEGDPVWRNAVLSGTPSLLALRHVLDDGTDEYKVIMLNKRYLSFRVIKVNRECVRGLWAGQQQELVYLRNRNPERGSIQNAKQALRNIINSSCDQPIGYPIYVSPLTTSYAETNEQLCSVVGGPLSLGAIKRAVLRLWRRVRRRCGEGCSSGASMPQDEGGFGHEGVYAMTPCNIHSGSQSMDNNQQVSVVRGGSLGRGNRGSLVSAGKPSSSTLASLAGLLAAAEASSGKGADQRSSVTETVENTEEKEPVLQRVRIQDPNQVYDAINLGRRIDVVWPDERMRARGGRSHWRDWLPERGMEGQVVHRWVPSHRDPNRRSHVDRTILLVKIDDKYVPIAESGTQDLGAEV